jgi:hypothetical protein
MKRIYQNSRTGVRVDLSTLSEQEEVFFREAQKRARASVPWFEFDDFAFGMSSPLYAKRDTDRAVVEHPLFAALKDMWLELGVRQGRIAPRPPHEKAKGTSRRTKAGRGQTAQRRDRAPDRELALAHSPSRPHS